MTFLTNGIQALQHHLKKCTNCKEYYLKDKPPLVISLENIYEHFLPTLIYFRTMLFILFALFLLMNLFLKSVSFSFFHQYYWTGARWCKWVVCFAYLPFIANIKASSFSTCTTKTTGCHAKNHGQRCNLFCTSYIIYVYLQVSHRIKIHDFLYNHKIIQLINPLSSLHWYAYGTFIFFTHNSTSLLVWRSCSNGIG